MSKPHPNDALKFMNKSQEDYYRGILADIEQDAEKKRKEDAKKREFEALDWHGKQAVLFGYLPLVNLATSSHVEFQALLAKANKDDKVAQFEVGRCYAHTFSCIAPDEDELDENELKELALYWQQKSAKLGYIPAKYALATLIGKKNPKAAFELVIEAARAGYAAAENTLGKYYLRNQVEPSYQNICFALEWFQKAQLQGVEEAANNLKLCLKYYREYHIPYPNSIKVNLSFLEEVAVVTPRKYPFTYRCDKDLKDLKREDQSTIIQTAGLVLKLAENIYEERTKNNKAQSEKKAISVEDLRNAWVRKHSTDTTKKQAVPPSPALENCLFDAARCFFYGYGVNENSEIGILYCQAADALNFAPAQNCLATYYKMIATEPLKSEEVTAYYVKAYELYLRAASNNFAEGQYNLGLFYQEGCSVIPEFEVPFKAFFWFMRAAHLGHEAAQRKVAECISTKYGIPKAFCETVKPVPALAAAGAGADAANTASAARSNTVGVATATSAKPAAAAAASAAIVKPNAAAAAVAKPKPAAAVAATGKPKATGAAAAANDAAPDADAQVGKKRKRR